MQAGLLLIALLAAAAVALPSLRGATITVVNTSDNGPGSLRQALADAVDGDTVNFDSSLNGQAITLTSGQLLVNKSITITGPGADQLRLLRSTTLGTPEFRIFYISSGNTVTISGLSISGGHVPSDFGGGIYNDQNSNLTLNSCEVSGNVGAAGAGIFSRNATLTINDSTVGPNLASSDGGGICNSGSLSGGAATLTINNSNVSSNWSSSGFGGGIFNGGFSSGSATLTVTNSILMGNRAIFGGSIYNDGDSSGNAVLTISNSTLSINSADTNGGGIYSNGISGNASLTVNNCTFSGNWAPNGSGIINDGRNLGAATLTIGNTILNVGPAGAGATLINNSGTITSRGYNLSSDNASAYLNATGDQNSTDPMLGPIQDNGGPTLTYGLLTGSPAIDAGDPNFTPPPDYDQRGPGYPRVLGNRVDIGSFEAQATPAPTPSPTPTATPRGHRQPHPHPTPRR
jgi:hypothetical protein